MRRELTQWDIAPSIVTEGTGPLPPDMYEIHKHALYCADTLFALRFLPREQCALAIVKLAECANAGRVILRPSLPRFALLCSTNAHESVIDRATEVIVRFQRGENVDGLLSNVVEYKGLRHELRREAVQLANNTQRPPPESPATGTGAGDGDGTKPPGLTPAVRKAWLSYQLAESVASKQLEDQDAYDWLTENGLPTDKGDLGELIDYEPPSFDTWSRYVREARPFFDASKYRRRKGRRRGKTIAKASEIEPPKKPRPR